MARFRQCDGMDVSGHTPPGCGICRGAWCHVVGDCCRLRCMRPMRHWEAMGVSEQTPQGCGICHGACCYLIDDGAYLFRSIRRCGSTLEAPEVSTHSHACVVPHGYCTTGRTRSQR